MRTQVLHTGPRTVSLLCEALRAYAAAAYAGGCDDATRAELVEAAERMEADLAAARPVTINRRARAFYKAATEHQVRVREAEAGRPLDGLRAHLTAVLDGQSREDTDLDAALGEYARGG